MQESFAEKSTDPEKLSSYDDTKRIPLTEKSYTEADPGAFVLQLKAFGSRYEVCGLSARKKVDYVLKTPGRKYIRDFYGKPGGEADRLRRMVYRFTSASSAAPQAFC